MAQIKKLQPGGKTPEKTTPKYGRLIQNGIEIQANDDMINWLAQQGYYGEQMANNLRNGDDQYLDTDEQGVGWIRNISAANPELKEKQQERTTRASRRLEGRRLNHARTDIQRLATYDYSKFAEKPKAKTPYKWDTLVIDYNTKEDGTKEFSNNQVNFDIIQRLNDLKNGLIIPDDQEFKDYDRVTQHYNNVKDLLEGTITRMRAGKLTADDEDILAGFGILATASKKDASDSKEDLTEATTNGIKKWLNTNLKLNDNELSTHSSYWTTNNSKELVATDELYKLIGGNYKNYWFDPESPYKGYVLLNGKLTPTNLVDKNGKQTAFGKWWESSDGREFRNKYAAGLWSEAAQYMAFDGSNQTWKYIDPYKQISPYLKSGMVYQDVSAYYDFDPIYGYVGAITKMNEPINGELLPSYKDYAIKEDGTLVDISTIEGQYTKPIRPSSRPSRVQTYDLTENGNFREFIYQYIDSSGKTHDILVTLDQNGRVVKLTEDNKEYNVLDQDGWQNNGTHIWKTIKEYLDRKTDKKNARKSAQHFQWTGYFQPGGKLKNATENKKHVEQVSGYITDPTKPYSLKDAKEGFSLGAADWADIISLGLDLGGLTLGEIPIAGEVAGYGSDLATLYADVVRDGFQLSDLGSFAGNVGLTSLGFVPTLGTGFGAGKLISKVKKVAPVLNGAFMAYGLYEGGQALSDILKGDLNVDTARGLMNGIMALRGIHKNKKSHRLMNEYGEPKTKATPKSRKRAGVPDLLEGLSTKQQNEILDALLKDKPELKYLDAEMKVPAKDWFDGDKITSYDEAWKAIGSKFTEDEIKKHRSGWQKFENSAGKGKNAVSESVESIWDRVKRRTTRANPDDYNLKSDINDESLEALRGESTWLGREIYAPRLKGVYEWNIPSNKKGGKIKKYDVGDRIRIDYDQLIPQLRNYYDPSSDFWDKLRSLARFNGSQHSQWFNRDLPSYNFEDFFERFIDNGVEDAIRHAFGFYNKNYLGDKYDVVRNLFKQHLRDSYYDKLKALYDVKPVSSNYNYETVKPISSPIIDTNVDFNEDVERAQRDIRKSLRDSRRILRKNKKLTSIKNDVFSDTQHPENIADVSTQKENKQSIFTPTYGSSNYGQISLGVSAPKLTAPKYNNISGIGLTSQQIEAEKFIAQDIANKRRVNNKEIITTAGKNYEMEEYNPLAEEGIYDDTTIVEPSAKANPTTSFGDTIKMLQADPSYQAAVTYLGSLGFEEQKKAENPKPSVVAPTTPTNTQKEPDMEEYDPLAKKDDVVGKNSNLKSGFLGKAFSVTSPLISYGITKQANKKVLDHTLKGIRDKYRADMKSMPMQHPFARYNFDPMISSFNTQIDNARLATQQLNKNFSDQKLQAAQNLALESNIKTHENNLWDRMSKHITDIDQYNAIKKAEFAEKEREIADYNRKLGGEQSMAEEMARAQHAQKEGENLNKMFAELRSKHDNYLDAKDRQQGFESYYNLYNKYQGLSDNDPEKANLAKTLKMWQNFLGSTGARSPWTGVSAWTFKS